HPPGATPGPPAGISLRPSTSPSVWAQTATTRGPASAPRMCAPARWLLDQPDRALEIADQIDIDSFAPGLVGRRCQVHLEAAIAHARRGQDNEAVARLIRVEGIGPQVLRYNHQAHQLIVELIRRGRRSTTPALRFLAHHAVPAG